MVSAARTHLFFESCQFSCGRDQAPTAFIQINGIHQKMGTCGAAPKDSPRQQPSHGKKVVVQAILPEICRSESTEKACNTLLLQEEASYYDKWSLTSAALQSPDSRQAHRQIQPGTSTNKNTTIKNWPEKQRSPSLITHNGLHWPTAHPKTR